MCSVHISRAVCPAVYAYISWCARIYMHRFPRMYILTPQKTSKKNFCDLANWKISNLLITSPFWCCYLVKSAYYRWGWVQYCHQYPCLERFFLCFSSNFTFVHDKQIIAEIPQGVPWQWEKRLF